MQMSRRSDKGSNGQPDVLSKLRVVHTKFTNAALSKVLQTDTETKEGIEGGKKMKQVPNEFSFTVHYTSRLRILFDALKFALYGLLTKKVSFTMDDEGFNSLSS